MSMEDFNNIMNNYMRKLVDEGSIAANNYIQGAVDQGKADLQKQMYKRRPSNENRVAHTMGNGGCIVNGFGDVLLGEHGEE